MDVKIYGQVHCGSWSQDAIPPDDRKSLCGNATERWSAIPSPQTMAFSCTSGTGEPANRGAGYASPSSERRTRRATGGPIVAYEHFAVTPPHMRCNKCADGPARFAWSLASDAGTEWGIAVEIGLARLAKEWQLWTGIVEARLVKSALGDADTAHQFVMKNGGPLGAARELSWHSGASVWFDRWIP